MNATLIFTPQGEGRGLYTEAIDLSRIGTLKIERATTIEFDNQAQCWIVRDRTGFGLYHSPSRQTCLDWEQMHFESNERMTHEQLSDGGDSVAAGEGIDG